MLEIWLFALLSIVLIVGGGWSTVIADKYERSARVYGLARILSSIGASILFSCIAYMYCKRICPDDFVKDRRAGITPTPLLMFLMLEWVVGVVVSSWLLYEMNRQPEIEGHLLKQVLGANVGISVGGVVVCIVSMLWYSGAEKREDAKLLQERERVAKEKDRVSLEATRALAKEAEQQRVIATQKQLKAAQETKQKAETSAKALEEQELVAYRLSKMSPKQREAYLAKNKPVVVGAPQGILQYGGAQYGGAQYGAVGNAMGKESQDLLQARRELEARNQALAQTEKETRLLQEQQSQLERKVRQEEGQEQKKLEQKIKEDRERLKADERQKYIAKRHTDEGDWTQPDRPVESRAVELPQDGGSQKIFNVRASGSMNAPEFKPMPHRRTIGEARNPTNNRRWPSEEDIKYDEQQARIRQEQSQVPAPVPPAPVPHRLAPAPVPHRPAPAPPAPVPHRPASVPQQAQQSTLVSRRLTPRIAGENGLTRRSLSQNNSRRSQTLRDIIGSGSESDDGTNPPRISRNSPMVR